MVSVQVAPRKTSEPKSAGVIYYIGKEADESLANQLRGAGYSVVPYVATSFATPLLEVQGQTTTLVVDATLSKAEILHCLSRLSNSAQYRIPVLLFATEMTPAVRKLFSEVNAHDCLTLRTSSEEIKEKIECAYEYLTTTSAFLNTEDNQLPLRQQLYSVSKRVIDFCAALILLILLSPLLLIVALIVHFDSPGGVFYTSKRAGNRYQTFDFYKFRTMIAGADKQREHLAKENKYSADKSGALFLKIDDDPRVTRVGRWLRKTSLDELPQLLNVLKGDMSLVGNRPLPLDEGATLTSDIAARRFLAPAGITGLWQVTKSYRSDITTEERINLDVTYANSTNPWLDIKIMFKTLPALLQKEE